jgi:hypothetical protein
MITALVVIAIANAAYVVVGVVHQRNKRGG